VFRYQTELPGLHFQWSETEGASSYIMEAALAGAGGDAPDFANPHISRQSAAASFVYPNMEPGLWYWRVKPVFPSVYEGSTVFSSAASFRIEQQAVETPAPETTVFNEPDPEPVPQPVPLPELRLLTPSAGASLAGLAALREQTVFTWEYNGEAARSRFVLSRNANPLQGRPQVERLNPGTAVRLDRLEEGNWYWTVEIETPEGSVVAGEPRQLQVLAIPILPAPANRQPANAHRIGIEELRNNRSIVFSWSAVPGANAYIFTLYRETAGGREQIIRREPENATRWTLTDLSVLDEGTFIWQVEAVNRGRNNAVEQQGRAGENSFIIDVPPAARIQFEETGVLYGN
jgi:hypothetical protein